MNDKYTDEEDAADKEKEDVFDAFLRLFAEETAKGKAMIDEWPEKPDEDVPSRQE